VVELNINMDLPTSLSSYITRR